MPHAARHSAKPRLGTRRQPEASRSAILKAALIEFAQEGLSGAPVEVIADAAGVNKALLYYYFHDKDTLYGAVLEEFFSRFLVRLTEALDRPATAGERFLSYVRAHFDTVAESPHYARIFLSEMMSAGRTGSPHLERLFARYLQPISDRVLGVLQDGITGGEFRPVKAEQFMPSAVGTIVHYFAVAPLLRKLRQVDPFSVRAIQERRAAVLDFAAAALFTDRQAGIELAARVAAAEGCASTALARAEEAGDRVTRRKRA